MAENKTQPTDASVADYLAAVVPDQRRKDALAVEEIMRRVTRQKPVLWGTSIVGFGAYSYVYKSGRKGDWPRTGFSPRKTSLSVYIMPGFDSCQELLAKLGKHKTSVSCLYINKIADIDLTILEQIVQFGWDEMLRMYPEGKSA